MKQLVFIGVSAPTLSFDPCEKPVAVAVGGDGNIICDDLVRMAHGVTEVMPRKDRR